VLGGDSVVHQGGERRGDLITKVDFKRFSRELPMDSFVGKVGKKGIIETD
jgi:hypothetical protein